MIFFRVFTSVFIICFANTHAVWPYDLEDDEEKYNHLNIKDVTADLIFTWHEGFMFEPTEYAQGRLDAYENVMNWIIYLENQK